jgi:5'-deoxynucleotidase
MSHFFAYLGRMKYILRWNLMRNTQPENIQEHSLQVAVIGHALAVIKNRRFGGSVNADRVVTLASFHEASEVITGDLATPIKYFNPEIKDAYKNIERVASEKLLSMLPEEFKEDYKPLLFQEDSEEHRLMKAADKICAYLKCLEELKAGNHEFEKATASIRKELDQMKRPEIDYFLKEFTPSFSLTLDELN